LGEAGGGYGWDEVLESLSDIKDHLAPEQMVSASGSVILLNGVGDCRPAADLSC
jgi:hypothetical protein